MISVLHNNLSDRPMELSCDLSLKEILKALKQVAQTMQMPVEIAEDTFGVTDGALFSGIFATPTACIAIYHKNHKRDYHSALIERKNAYGKYYLYIHMGGTSANQRSINMGKSYTYVQDGHIRQNRPGLLGRMLSNEGKEGMRDEELYYDAVIDMVAEALVKAEFDRNNPQPKTPTPKAPTPQPKKPTPIQTASTQAKPEPKPAAKPEAKATLQASIGLETMGGVCTKMLAAGTALPAEKTMIFSTAADEQSSVELHILRGEGDKVAENQSMGKYVLREIPPMKRGVPQIQLTFAVDIFGDLEVSAKELISGKEIQVVVDLPDCGHKPQPAAGEKKPAPQPEAEKAVNREATPLCDLTVAEGMLAGNIILQATGCKPILTLKKSAALPTEGAAVVIIRAENRSSGEICVYEAVAEQKLLGTIALGGIFCGDSHNGCVEVQLLVDAQGKLQVYAEDMSTEQPLTVTFTPAAAPAEPAAEKAEPSGLFANGMGNINRLRELKALLDEGILTQEEFDAEKKKILG